MIYFFMFGSQICVTRLSDVCLFKSLAVYSLVPTLVDLCAAVSQDAGSNPVIGNFIEQRRK